MSILVTGPKWLDNLEEDDTLQFKWETHTAAGASVDPSVAGTIRIYKNNSITERTSASGITDTRAFDGLTGIHSLTIDTSDNTDAGFYVVNENYMAVLVGATIDGVANVNAVLAHFSTENRFHNMGAISQDKPAADAFETMLDGTGGNQLLLGQLAIVAEDNGSAFVALGAGVGHGMQIAGGATGHGIWTLGGFTSGDGIHAFAQTNGNGIHGAGASAGHGLDIVGGSTGDGINSTGGSTSGDGIRSDGGGDGSGMRLVGTNAQSGMSVTGVGANGALRLTNSATGPGLQLQGAGSSAGLLSVGGPTGNGIEATGGVTSGDGIKATAPTEGDGFDPTGAGTGFDINGDLNGSVLSVVNQSASSGSSINTPAISFTLTTGSISSGSIADTVALDDVEHQIDDAAGVLDCEYEFNVGGSGIPTQVGFTGRSNGGNDTIIVEAFDYVAVAFVQVGTIPGKGAASNDSVNFTVFTTMVGTGVDLGQVRVRLSATGLTSATLSVDQIFVSFAVVNLSVGYQDGSVWIDTVNGTAGTTLFVNGTADNPVDSLADASTIASNLGLRGFRVIGGSSLTLAQSYVGFSFVGAGRWTLALGNQDISGTFFQLCDVSGIATSPTERATFNEVALGSVTLPPFTAFVSGVAGPLTCSAAGDYFLFQCASSVAGTSTPVMDSGVAVANVNLNFRDYSGGIELENFGAAGVDNMSLEGNGQLILNANCVGGTVAIRGNFTVVDNAGGAVALSDDARFENNKNADHILRRNTASARASVDGDTVSVRSTLGAVSKLTNRFDTTTNVGFGTVFEEDDTTEFFRQTLVTDGNADPIVSADTV